jgi:hypothetical protein
MAPVKKNIEKRRKEEKTKKGRRERERVTAKCNHSKNSSV